MSQPDRDAALETAIERVGTSRALAAAVGVTAQALSQWKRVPPNRVLAVERVSGVSRHDLRSDLYPRDGGPSGSASSAA